MHLIRSGAIEGYLQLVNRYQQNPTTILQDAGISAAQLRQPDALVSYKKLADLLDYSAEQCHDPYFCLHLSSEQNPLALGELALVGGQQPTLGESLRRTNQHLHLHAMGVHLDQTDKGEWVEFELRFDFTNIYGLTQLIQLSAGQLYNSVVSMMGSHHPSIKIHLQQAEPKHPLNQDPSPFLHVVFNSHFNGVQLPKAWLTRKPQPNEEIMRDHFERRIQLLESAYPNNLQAQVRFIISNLLSSGECTLERVSRALDLHPRVLQNRLKKSNSSFRQLLQDTRCDTAKQFLLQNQLSITDLALNLGYAEVAVFSRHFKKWTGHSPYQWRKQQEAQGENRQ